MKNKISLLQQGFTLVELLIVVIILAILAAIVVPQFASSTDDAKVSALDSSLANMRAAIDLYYQQHGSYPSGTAAAGATCPGGGTAGTGAVDTVQAFIDQMTRYTNSAGQSCTTKDTVFKYGPYLKKDALPTNPITELNGLVISTTGALGMTGAAVGAGWRFDNLTGQFIADDAAYDDH
ncbi:MAG: type II secretion system GspH family protein [Gammaproteobacteria bacterium]|nr:type II secretion system GspH family protein [Gammaproteobacteria bacterium]